MALQGAELILWSHGPEPVPQGWLLDVTMRIRAFDNHVTLAVANYAGELPYLCSNWPGYTGEPLGRACVVDRSGIIEADTGTKTGVAVVPHRPDPRHGYLRPYLHRKPKPLPLPDRPEPEADRPSRPKRNIRVTIAQVGLGSGAESRPRLRVPTKFLDDAGSRKPDVILMAEFDFPTDTPAAAKTFAQVAERAGKYHTLHRHRRPARSTECPVKDGRSTSWAYLWDRTGNVVGKYRISQYGGSKELPVFKTDFGVIGVIICGDVYSPEIARALALQGAEIILCRSQSWGASGQFNLRMQQARAIDNAVYMAAAHSAYSEVSQRSYVIDPYGYPLAATPYWRNSVVSADVDLDAGRIWFARSNTPGTRRPQRLSGRLLSQDDSGQTHGLPPRAFRRPPAGTVSPDRGEDPCRPRFLGGNQKKMAENRRVKGRENVRAWPAENGGWIAGSNLTRRRSLGRKPGQNGNGAGITETCPVVSYIRVLFGTMS